MDAKIIGRIAQDALDGVRIPEHLEAIRDDLHAEALLAAANAVEAHDPGKGELEPLVFICASRAVQRAIRDELRARGYTVADTAKQDAPTPEQINQSWARAMKRFARLEVPSPASQGESMALDPKAQNAGDGKQPPLDTHSPVHARSPLVKQRDGVGHEGALTPNPYDLADTASEGAATPPADIAHRELIALLPRYLDALAHDDERGARVLRLRYLDGWTQARVARKLGCERSTVSRIEARALAAMRGAMDAGA